jgi:hypothetical protein
MKPHEQRVIDEESELNEKLEKLHVFIQDSPVFKSLSISDQRLLIDQCCVMSFYHDILLQRISQF